jgi:AcrR family transcriptional regulator
MRAAAPIGRARVSRKDQLLDAAEHLFAMEGYDAVSLNRISEYSGVNVGLIHYYFGSKETMLHEVIARRSEEFLAKIRASHARFEKRSQVGPRRIAELIEAHFRPFVDYAVSKDPGERNYIRLLVHASFWERRSVRDVAAQLWDVSQRLIELSQRCYPEADRMKLRVALYLAGSTMSYMFQDAGLLSAMTEGKYQHDTIDRMFPLVQRFFEAGIDGLATMRESPGGKLGRPRRVRRSPSRRRVPPD